MTNQYQNKKAADLQSVEQLKTLLKVQLSDRRLKVGSPFSFARYSYLNEGSLLGSYLEYTMSRRFPNGRTSVISRRVSLHELWRSNLGTRKLLADTLRSMRQQLYRPPGEPASKHFARKLING
jgi:hypothetical protein